MQHEAIKQQLQTNHQAFIEYIRSLSDAQLEYAPEGKWTAAQQLDHIYKSVRPLTRAFMLPNFIIKAYFGSSNRPSKTYDELVKRYTDKIQLGGRASPRFTPKPTKADQREPLIAALTQVVNKLCKQVDGFSAKEMDTMILPHPLLGKVTLNEMLYFTIYHVTHHQMIIERDLAGFKNN